MSDLFGNDYTPQVTKTALDSMPFTLPGEEVSKTFTGSDAFSTVASSLATEPQVASGVNSSTSFADKIFGVPPAAQAIRDQARNEGTGPWILGQKWFDDNGKRVLYGALFVVVGLFVISRGFGMIGEEGENVVVSLGDPTKFPGIGHAIQGIKKRK
jgi:hypothetical protein